MLRNFDRGNRKCGKFDASTAPIASDFAYDVSKPCLAFSKTIWHIHEWSKRHLGWKFVRSDCTGQAKYRHQYKRFRKWKMRIDYLDRKNKCPIGWS